MERLKGWWGELAAWWDNWIHPERNSKSIHPWRWRALTLWIIIFSIAVMISISDNRKVSDANQVIAKQNKNLIAQLQRNKASVGQLQKTNCGQLGFLIAARNTRIRAAHDPKTPGQEQENNLRAAASYDQLAKNYSPEAVGDHCQVPDLLPIP